LIIPITGSQVKVVIAIHVRPGYTLGMIAFGITAGVGQKPGETRLQRLERNAAIVTAPG
jgi:hypothetical protein